MESDLAAERAAEGKKRKDGEDTGMRRERWRATENSGGTDGEARSGGSTPRASTKYATRPREDAHRVCFPIIARATLGIYIYISNTRVWRCY